MKYLLDTHTLLWVLFEDEKLSDYVKKIIRDPENDIYVSMITYWEISLKYGIGKLELENITPQEIPQQAKEINIQTLDLLVSEVSTFFKLPKIEHKDPFDRMIVWQAINREIPLISKDSDLEDYAKFGLTVLWK